MESFTPGIRPDPGGYSRPSSSLLLGSSKPTRTRRTLRPLSNTSTLAILGLLCWSCCVVGASASSLPRMPFFDRQPMPMPGVSSSTTMTTTKAQDILSRQSNDLVPDMELEKFVHLQKAFLYSTTAMTCLIIYDYIITFDMEVEYIWKSRIKLSLTNCLFFANRYFPIIRAVTFLVFSLRPPHSEQRCTHGTDFNSWTTMINVATVEILMLTRTWALWGRSRVIGLILVGFFLSACAVCAYVVESTIKPIPGVVPLPPIIVLPCDRPSPFKYMINYCVALALELISFGFMMGRIAYLEKRTNRLKGVAVPLIKALAVHGAYYFCVVIFTMTFTLLSAFVESLARAVVNAGLSPTITSIACNRVIFSLHDTYLSIKDPKISGPQNNEEASGRWWKRRSEQRSRVETPYTGIGGGRTRQEQSTYEDAYDIAVTRNELLTKDMGNTADYNHGQGNMDMDADTFAEGRVVQKQSFLSPELTPTKTPTTAGSTAVANVSLVEVRDPKLRPPFHGHNPSSSTVLTSDDSANHTTLAYVSSRERDGGASKSPTAWTYASLRTSKSASRSLRRPGSASSSQGGGGTIMFADGPSTSPHGVKRSSSFGKPAFSVRARVMSPNRAPRVEERDDGNDDNVIEVPSPGIDTTESIEPISPRSFGDRIGSLLWKRKGPLRDYLGPHSPSSGSFAFTTGTGRRSSVGGPGEGSVSSLPFTTSTQAKTTGTRTKERHPLDHHYEMDTIHSTADYMTDGGWAASTFEDVEDVDEDGVVIPEEWTRADGQESDPVREERDRTITPGLSHRPSPLEGQAISRNV